MAKSKQSAWFLKILQDKKLRLVQPPQTIGFDSSSIMQYAAVSRQDDEGFVQIGYHPERLQEAMEIADIKNLAPGFRIGNKGKIIIAINMHAHINKDENCAFKVLS